MAAFATHQDLEARWKTLSAAEQATADVLLEDAAVIIRAECEDADDIDPGITKFVSCGMVKRAMIASGSEGIGQDNLTAGPFSQQRSYTNPMGNVYLTKQDRRLLGCSRQSAGMVNMGPEDDYIPTRPVGYGSPVNWWELEQ